MRQADLSLIQFLNEFLPSLSSTIPTKIGDGGDGAYAYELSRAFDTMYLEHEIMLLIPYPKCGHKVIDDQFTKDIERITKFSNGEEIEGTDIIPYQIGIKLGRNILFNRWGLIDGKEFLMCEKIVFTQKRLKDLVDNKELWSSVFDRSCIEMIREKLQEMPFEYGLYLGGAKFDLMWGGTMNEYTTAEIKKREMARGLGRIFGGLLGGLMTPDKNDDE